MEVAADFRIQSHERALDIPSSAIAPPNMKVALVVKLEIMMSSKSESRRPD